MTNQAKEIRCPLCNEVLIKENKVIQSAKEHYYESSNGYGGRGCKMGVKEEGKE